MFESRPNNRYNLTMLNRGTSAAGAFALATLALLTGCSTDAEVASQNLSQEADQFRIERRVVFFNGITDTYMLTIEGRCSIKDQDNQLEVTCKTGDNQYKKHFLGLSDNVTYFVEQVEGADVSVYRYKVIFKPTAIVPTIETSTP
jgi:hypothetical protein